MTICIGRYEEIRDPHDPPGLLDQACSGEAEKGRRASIVWSGQFMLVWPGMQAPEKQTTTVRVNPPR